MRSKIFILSVGLLFGLPASVGAQITAPVGIQYNLVLYPNKAAESLSYNYQPGGSFCFTPLYPPEMKIITNGFLTYVDKMRTVNNHVGPLGQESLSALGDYGPAEALTLRSSGGLEKIGHLYLNRTIQHPVSVAEGRIDAVNFEIIDGEYIMEADTNYTEDLRTGEMIMVIVENKEDVYEVMNGAGFTEEWTFDQTKGIFEKSIKYITLDKSVADPSDGAYRGQQVQLAFKCGKFSKKNISESRLVKKDIEYTVLFNKDFKAPEEFGYYEGMAQNAQGRGYIESTVRNQLLISMFQAINDGQLAAMHFDGINFNPTKAKPMSKDDFFKRLTVKDTNYVEDIVKKEMFPVIVTIKTEISDVVGFRFLEDWYMDYENMCMYKRVKSIVMLKEKIDEHTGEAEGVTPINGSMIKLNYLY